MCMATKLSSNQIQEKLARLNTGWIIKDGKLHKQFVFDSFQEAFDWMGKVAKISEEIDHHPDWSNSYKKVTVDLITHCDHGITELDFMLAKKMEKIVNFKK
jgi:4a-hydroxytetrahydrobiopterin dehydratase